MKKLFTATTIFLITFLFLIISGSLIGVFAAAAPTPTPTLPPDPNSFPYAFPNYYSFARNLLFGGVDFWGPGGAQPQDILETMEFVNDIMACQGGQNAPSLPPRFLICIKVAMDHYQALGKGNFVAALGNVNWNWQCGQFIWSVETLLGWHQFVGASCAQTQYCGGVYAWYLLNPDHSQTGYTFIQNVGQGSNIQPGDILIYGPGFAGDPFGHTAIVTVVQADKFHITVAEANFHNNITWLRNTAVDNYLNGTTHILGWWRHK